MDVFHWIFQLTKQKDTFMDRKMSNGFIINYQLGSVKFTAMYEISTKKLST